MAARGSLVARAVLVLVLMVLFFATAIAAVAALVLAARWLFEFAGELRGRALIFVGLSALVCLFAAGVVAWSVLPRPDRFEAPGPEVSMSAQPPLVDEIRQIASATGERCRSTSTWSTRSTRSSPSAAASWASAAVA